MSLAMPSLQESNINHTIGISETGGPGKSNIDEASQHLAQLCDKAFDAEDGANRANQEEILCWSIYGKDFRVQFNKIIKNSRGKIGEKKARSLLYDSITKQLSIIRKKRSQELDNVGHQISSENTEISARLGKILPIPEDSSSTPAKAETNIDYDDVYFDEEFDDDVYFDEEVASRSDKVEPGQRSSSNQALSHDDSDHSHNNDSEEEMPDESDDDGYSGCGGYNEYGESDRGYYYDLSSGKKTYKNSDYIISAY
ncbi:10607_t:CDS:2 [Dentiscutata erythropus]|uniref:10607_t:CDS:1 n=1 Tax=Dentiscutata erythropus TaxID=1348616 RepID=A0A9N9NIV4_9GLOM|nr:10607_t:CDS:2 [Dentiscutata erythropus]